MFACVFAAEGSRPDVLVAVARDFSPRVEVCAAREVMVDLAGLHRLFGDAKTIAGELRRTAADRGLRVRIAIAATRTAARLLTRARAGITIVDPGREAEAVADLPIELLQIFCEPKEPEPTEPPEPIEPAEPIPTLRRWGLRTLGELAALPPDELAARLGQGGVDWQRLARGGEGAPLVPSLSEERFEQALDLEWPIEGLEPLSFVLARLLEPLSAHLQRRDRGAAVLHIRLRLVTKEVHERSLQLPAPMRDARTLRTLALLDLESHPPSAAIDRVVVSVDPTPGRVIQFSLLTRPLPSVEHLSTLIARLSALMGEERVGSPVIVDSWQPGAFEMKGFNPGSGIGDPGCDRIPNPESRIPTVAVRRFRFPVPARVHVDRGIPVRITIDRRGFPGGRVEKYAGPWRASGGWWTDDAKTSWERDEWDVALSDGATYRVYRERNTDAWFIEGMVD
jgi:protein ImuB